MCTLGVIKKAIFIIILFFMANSALALPQYESTRLPFPDLNSLDENDKKMLEAVVALDVYQDDQDPNQYYYVPPFHIRQYTRGAAGMVIHTHNVKQFAGANKELELRTKFSQEYSVKQLEELTEEQRRREILVKEAEEKLEEAIVIGNEQLITLRRQSLRRARSAYESATKNLADATQVINAGGSLLPAGLGRAYFERAIFHLASAGMNIPYSGGEDPSEVQNAITTKLHEFSSSYGGFLSVNLYAGFTKRELDSLVAYRAKYFPHIKVSLLPVEKLLFFPLTDWQFDDDKNKKGAKLFTEINGSGDYLGSALVLDTSIVGSTGLAAHMAPFILPVGIKAIFKQQLKPAVAELRCDFRNGFSVTGRADVRDGLIIFDNDLTTSISPKDENQGACNLSYISGDPSSAKFASLEYLEKFYEKLRLKRTIMSEQEKQRYYQGILDDIDHNRRPDEPTYRSTLRTFLGHGLQSIVIEGLTRAADFHWHTHQENMSNISTVNFVKKISIEGHQTIEKQLPLNLCLVYNSQLNAYDRCIDLEEVAAKNMHDAMNEVHNSVECEDSDDPLECGQKRDQAGRTPRRDHAAPAEDDNVFLGTIR